jgi:hypothetical protein
MSPEAGLALCIGGIAAGALVMPVEFLPHRTSISGRLVIGCLLMIAGGAGLGRAFLA